ncbi:hypothetical protein [Nocardiopsis synnemataformans]|uniref:hypothetical protein n=1 Tax=Nocardiopsis synnemataformans TaxID=61305 RepID=UPI003EBB03B2
MSEDVQESGLRVELVGMRGDVLAQLAEIRGDLRVVCEQNANDIEHRRQLAADLKQVKDAQTTFVTKTEMDQRLRNSLTVASVVLGTITLLINTGVHSLI